MISVNVYRNKDNGHIRGFRVSGHAEYADKGQDIVCAAVSVLAINTINAFDTYLPEELVTVNTDEKNASIECYFDDEPSEKAVLLLDTFILGIKGIKEQHSSKYLKLIDESEDENRR